MNKEQLKVNSERKSDFFIFFEWNCGEEKDAEEGEEIIYLK